MPGTENSQQTHVAPIANTVTEDEIAKLAYSYWQERGCQGGDPNEDWVRAESALKSMASAS